MMRNATCLVFGLAATLLGGCGRSDPASLDDPKTLTIQLTSEHLRRAAIPKVYTCDGKDVSPPLAWTGVPASAKSLALLCDDPDAPRTCTHWLVPYLPTGVKELPEAITEEQLTHLKKRARARTTSASTPTGAPALRPARTTTYSASCLDTELTADAGASRKALLKAVDGHVLAEGKLVGNLNLVLSLQGATRASGEVEEVLDPHAECPRQPERQQQ